MLDISINSFNDITLKIKLRLDFVRFILLTLTKTTQNKDTIGIHDVRFVLYIEAVAKPHLRRRLRQQHNTQIRREPERAKADRSRGRVRRGWRSEWTMWSDHQQRAQAASSDRSKQQPNRLLFIARREVYR